MKNQSTFKYEKIFAEKGYDFVIGVDEAGRGPLAGPVVAAAATVRKSQIPNPKFQTNSKSQIQKIKLIKDSKLLSEKQREDLYDFIFDYFHVGVGICDHKTIDRVNILNATHLAMKKAIASLKSKCKMQNYKFNDNRCIVLVDGNKLIPNFSTEQQFIISGDRLVKSISAASIVAKVTRDRIMHEMDKKYPEYGFSRHKGYGTKLHKEMIRKQGICGIHRKSFEPIKSWTNRKKIDRLVLGR